MNLFHYLDKLLNEIDFILKVHCGFSLEEMGVLSWSEVENYYKKWYDYEMNQKITQMALAGVEYKDADKCKTSYFRDYINEAERNKKELTLREEYKKKLKIHEVVKRPKFLFEKEKVK